MQQTYFQKSLIEQNPSSHSLTKQCSQIQLRKREMKFEQKQRLIEKSSQKFLQGSKSFNKTSSSHNKQLFQDSQASDSEEMKSEGGNSEDIELLINEYNEIVHNNQMLDENEDLPIRKPQSAYVIFGKMKRDLIMKQCPGIKVTEVVKQIACLWQSLSKQEKYRYKEAAKRDKARYLQELLDITRCNKALDKPKKPLTPYMIFVRETRPKVVKEFPKIAALDIMKEVGKKWQSITKNELDYFKEKSKIDMLRYKKEHTMFICEINELRKGQDKSELSQVNSDSHLNEDFFQNSTPPKLIQDQKKQIQQQPQLKINCSKNDQQYNHQQKFQTNEIIPFSRISTSTGTSSKFGKMKHPLQNQQHESFFDKPIEQDQNIEEDDSESFEQKQKQPKRRNTMKTSRPKKPLSAYIYFSQEYREKLKAQHINWSSADIMKQVSMKWLQMKKDQKQRFNDLASIDKQRYDKELVQYSFENDCSENEESFEMQDKENNNLADLKTRKNTSTSLEYNLDLQHQNSQVEKLNLNFQQNLTLQGPSKNQQMPLQPILEDDRKIKNSDNFFDLELNQQIQPPQSMPMSPQNIVETPYINSNISPFSIKPTPQAQNDFEFYYNQFFEEPYQRQVYKGMNPQKQSQQIQPPGQQLDFSNQQQMQNQQPVQPYNNGCEGIQVQNEFLNQNIFNIPLLEGESSLKNIYDHRSFQFPSAIQEEDNLFDNFFQQNQQQNYQFQ